MVVIDIIDKIFQINDSTCKYVTSNLDMLMNDYKSTVTKMCHDYRRTDSLISSESNE